jgi:hypothetical protein
MNWHFGPWKRSDTYRPSRTELDGLATYLVRTFKDDASASGATRYNLACYYTTVGDYDTALRELRAGVEGSSERADWADQDPALTALKNAHPVEFARVLKGD